MCAHTSLGDTLQRGSGCTGGLGGQCSDITYIAGRREAIKDNGTYNKKQGCDLVICCVSPRGESCVVQCCCGVVAYFGSGWYLFDSMCRLIAG